MLRLALALLVLLGGVADAQDLRARAGAPNWSAGNGTVTAAVMVTNATEQPVRAVPRVDLPPDWRLLTGSAETTVDAGATALVMVGISVPARVIAGAYHVRVALTEPGTDRVLARDSIAVRVPTRRAMELTLLERPNFVIAGRSYDARFLLRNRGNASTTVRFEATSSLGTPTPGRAAYALAPDESRELRIRVQTRAALQEAIDDILEVAALDVDSTAPRTYASARVTVVPEPNRSIEEYLRIPTRVNLRAASTDAVSRFEAFGQGPVRDGAKTQLEFLVRGPTGEFAAFGERDEYRATLAAPGWRLRAGDQTFMLSALTSSGQPGFGVGGDVTRGMIRTGAHAQHFRRAFEEGDERGGYLSVSPTPGLRFTVNGADRAGGPLAGRVGSAAARIERDYLTADAEVARSTAEDAAGIARSLRASGALAGGSVSYDLAHTAADTGFRGSQRGAEHSYVIARSRLSPLVTVGVNGSLHRVDLSPSVGIPYDDRLENAAVNATLADRLMLEASRTARGARIGSTETDATQGGLRGRLDQDVPFGSVAIEVETGRSNDGRTPRWFSDATLGARRPFDWGHLGAYVQRYGGGSILKGVVGTTTVGGDASARLPGGMQATLFGYATRQQTTDAQWHTQLDAVVTRPLPNGATVTLRARLLQGGSLTASDRNVAFLEYGIPMRLPISRLRTPGRVYGRVVDAVTGRGVGGALVRLGPQVAITDRDGGVAFGGVPAGEHRLSMSQETSFANAVFVDDATVAVDGTRTRPTTFRVAVARSARVDIDVRRFALARTAVAGKPDSLAEAGVVGNATLILAGERDTLYRTTGENGRTAFTDIPPGRWTISIRGDAPAFHRFDPDRVELELTPGEQRAISFRLVPRKREVQIIGESQDLQATPATPKGQAGAASSTRTVKPNELRPDH